MALNLTLMILSLIVLSNLVPHQANARLLAEKAQETTKQGGEKLVSTQPNTEASDPKDLGDVKTIPPFTNIPGFPFPTIPGGFPFPSPLPDIPIFNPPFGNIPGVPFPPLPNIPFPFLSPPPI